MWITCFWPATVSLTSLSNKLWSRKTDKKWHNKQQLDWCKIPSDGVLISSGTLDGDLAGITIWNPWSNKSDANLEVSACKARMLLIFPILWDLVLNFFNRIFPLWGARRSTRIFVQHILIYFVSSAQCIRRKICLLCLFDLHSALISDLV